MNIDKFKLVIFIFLVILSSCNERQKVYNQPEKKETPKALKEDNLELKSFSRSRGDLVEELYQELVDKTPVLKELELEIDGFNSQPSELKEKLNTFENKSDIYYSSANSQLSAIKDSSIRNKILALIVNSKTLYSNRNAELNSLLKQVLKNSETINEHHIVLKILLTLPIIEKYQKDNIIDKTEFKDLIKLEKNIIEHVDKNTPKY